MNLQGPRKGRPAVSPRARAHAARELIGRPTNSILQRLIDGKKKSPQVENANVKRSDDPDFSRLISLFERPVYGGTDIIIKNYLSYNESREECAYVGYVWRCDDDAYMDYMKPPHLPSRTHKDWLFSSIFYVALDDEADVFPEKLQRLLSSIVETKNQAVFGSYSQALRILHCLHVELRCPAALHNSFWTAHAVASSGNFASLISRITRLAESRLCLLDIFRFVSGYPSYSTQIRLRRIQEQLAIDDIIKESLLDDRCPHRLTESTVAADSSLSATPEDIYSPIKPRSDSLLGQTPQQIRKRARDTILQTESPGSLKDVLARGYLMPGQVPSEPTARGPGVAPTPKQQLFQCGENLETVEEDSEGNESSDNDTIEQVGLKSLHRRESGDGASFFGSQMSLKSVSRHSILPVIRKMSSPVQTFGDLVSDVMDLSSRSTEGALDDSKAIEGALRRFTEMGKMFATSASALERQALIDVDRKNDNARKNVVVRMLVFEFLDSLPWKVNEFLLLGHSWRNDPVNKTM